MKGANGLNPYLHLKYIFETAPKLDRSKEGRAAVLLPQNAPGSAELNNYTTLDLTLTYWHNRISKMYSPECDSFPQQFYDVANSASGASTCGNVTATIHVGAYSADVYSGADESTLAAVCRVLRSC